MLTIWRAPLRSTIGQRIWHLKSLGKRRPFLHSQELRKKIVVRNGAEKSALQSEEKRLRCAPVAGHLNGCRATLLHKRWVGTSCTSYYVGSCPGELDARTANCSGALFSSPLLPQRTNSEVARGKTTTTSTDGTTNNSLLKSSTVTTHLDPIERTQTRWVLKVLKAPNLSRGSPAPTDHMCGLCTASPRRAWAPACGSSYVQRRRLFLAVRSRQFADFDVLS